MADPRACARIEQNIRDIQSRITGLTRRERELHNVLQTSVPRDIEGLRSQINELDRVDDSVSASISPLCLPVHIRLKLDVVGASTVAAATSALERALRDKEMERERLVAELSEVRRQIQNLRHNREASQAACIAQGCGG